MRLPRFSGLLLLGALLVAPRSAEAYRPFDGTDADVAAPKEIELEIGPSFTRSRSARRLSLPSTVLNFGLIPRLELVIDFANVVRTPSEVPGPTDHLDDADVMLKVVLRRGSLQGESGPSVAVEGGVLIPTNREDHDVGGAANLIVSHAWETLILHLNNTLFLTREGTVATFNGLIVELPTGMRLRPVAELYVSHELGVETTFSALFGAIYARTGELAFDAGVRAAVTDGQPVGELRLGLTWAVPMLR